MLQDRREEREGQSLPASREALLALLAQALLASGGDSTEPHLDAEVRARAERLLGDAAGGEFPDGTPDDSDAPSDACDEPPLEVGEEPVRRPRLSGTPPRRKGRRLVKPAEAERATPTPEQRLLLLDTWRRSGLPAGDFGDLVGISKHTLYSWKKRFDEHGPAGLMDQPRGTRRGSRLPELTKRTILLLKESNPDWGCQRISDLLLRGPALPASPAAVANVLHEAGYQLEESPTRPHPDKVRHFERARPNQLWQTDLFTFILKRQNRRVYLVAFMDDHSRFLVGYGLHASQSAALVLEVLRASLTTHGTPEEILNDNGSQYVTWRGTSQFTKELYKRGIRQVIARPRHPQTLGKIERFWGTLWRECLEAAVFLDLEDARRRIGLFIDHYNFQRPHQGIDGLVPADRFFGAAPEVLRTLKARVAANALALARQGVPKPPFYVTGQLGDQAFSVHAEGERLILTRGGEGRQEVEFVRPESAELPPAVADTAELSATELSAAEPSASELPQPLCPDGSPPPSPANEGMESPLPPGVSPLDDVFGAPQPCDERAAQSDDPLGDDGHTGQEPWEGGLS